jgi:hypothetical protein
MCYVDVPCYILLFCLYINDVSYVLLMCILYPLVRCTAVPSGCLCVGRIHSCLLFISCSALKSGVNEEFRLLGC